MSRSPNLSLPYIQPAQAQKHITHNLAIERLDALVQLSVTELYATELPAAPFDGQVIGIGRGATGGIEGQDGKLAYFTNGAWMYIEPRNGFKAWVEAKGSFYVYQDGDWQVLLTAGGEAAAPDRMEGLGINAAWNDANRLAVASDATLLSHDGAGHQLKVNKAAAADTASLLFQSEFSGRAEVGLAGDDDFSVKVSADGDDWTTALSINGKNGDLTVGQIHAGSVSGDAVQATPTDTTPGRVMRADWGYGPGNLIGQVSQKDGVPTGAVVESGENANGYYVRYADGTQIMTIRDVSNSQPIKANETLSGTCALPAVASDVFHVFASVRTYASEAYARFAAENLRTSATPVGLGNAWASAWAVHAKAAVPAVRVDITVVGRWF